MDVKGGKETETVEEPRGPEHIHSHTVLPLYVPTVARKDFHNSIDLVLVEDKIIGNRALSKRETFPFFFSNGQ